jgi:hypothetical protein
MRTRFRTIGRHAVLVAVLGPLLLADDIPVPDAPSIGRSVKDPTGAGWARNVSTFSLPSTHHLRQGAVPAASGRSFQFDKDVADQRYWDMTVAMFGASIANAELTQRCEEEKRCSFLPPVLSNRTGKYGIGIPSDLALAYIGYKLKKRNHKWIWVVPEALSTSVNLYVGIHSWRRQR